MAATTPMKQDRRIERTRQLLSKALMELIIERGYEGITIQDITDRANVSRTTFYLHFKDKDELLFASMQQIYDGLMPHHEKLLPLHPPGNRLEDVDCGDASDFRHVAEFADFYRVMLSKQGSVTFILRVLSYLTEAITPTLEARFAGVEPQVPLGLVAAFLAGAEVGVMKWWVESGMRQTPEDMARIQFFLATFGLKGVLGSEPEAARPNEDVGLA